jgi:hypothetical protein
MQQHRGAAIGVAVASVTFFVSLSAVLVGLGWIALTIYAIVKAIGDASEAPDPLAVVLMFVLLVGGLVTGLTASLALIGRSMTPRRRRRD